jgi:hypothetical protein
VDQIPTDWTVITFPYTPEWGTFWTRWRTDFSIGNAGVGFAVGSGTATTISGLEVSELSIEFDLPIKIYPAKDFGAQSVVVHKVSETRAFVAWLQTDNTYPMPTSVGQDFAVHAVLFDVSGTAITIVDTAKYVMVDKDDPYAIEYMWLSMNGGVSKIVLPDGDLVAHWTSYTYRIRDGVLRTHQTVDDGIIPPTGNWSYIGPAVRLHVEGDTISFVWHRKWGSSAQMVFQWAAHPLWDASTNTIVYLSDNNQMVRVDPSDGHWIAITPVVQPSNVAWLSLGIVQKGNNFISIQDDGLTYVRGTLNPMTFSSTEYNTPTVFGTMRAYLEEEYQYSVHDVESDTWLVSGWYDDVPYTISHAGEDYMKMFRCTLDDDGHLVILKIYAQDIDTWTYTPMEITGGHTYGEHAANEFGWYGDLVRWPVIPIDGERFAHIYGGTVAHGSQIAPGPDMSRSAYHHDGLQIVYDWKEYDPALPYGMGNPQSKASRWGSAPYAGNWPYYFEWGPDGFYSTAFYLDGAYLGGRVVVALSVGEQINWENGAEMVTGQGLIFLTVYAAC